MDKHEHEALTKNLSQTLEAMQHGDMEKAFAHLRMAQHQVQTQIAIDPEALGFDPEINNDQEKAHYLLTTVDYEGDVSGQYKVLASYEMETDIVGGLAYIEHLKNEVYEDQPEEWEQLVRDFGTEPTKRPIGFVNWYIHTVCELDGTNMMFLPLLDKLRTIQIPYTKTDEFYDEDIYE